MDATCTIDGLTLPLVRPASVEELAEVVRRAASAGQAVYPVGGGTQLATGLPPTRPGFAVDMRGLARVIDYPARDMTVTVEAGISLTDLRQTLAAEGQRLPVDVSRPEVATLGGAVAANTSGPRRLGEGTLRDYVIGITTLNDRAELTRAGGRVVKNVAGYDLAKLHTGAFGTLGVITQLTLKVRPAPEESALVTFGCAAGALAPLLDGLHASRTRPVCIDLLNARAAADLHRRCGLAVPTQPWVLFVGFEEGEHAVRWQIQQLLRERTGTAVQGVEAIAGSAAAPVWEALTETAAGPDATLSLKAGVLPGRLAAWCRLVEGLPPGPPALHAHAGSGVVRVHHQPLTLDQARGMLETATREAADAGGYVTLTRCPTDWKRTLRVWGARRDDAWLMREVKRRLDPNDLFNPGRFLDGA